MSNIDIAVDFWKHYNSSGKTFSVKPQYDFYFETTDYFAGKTQVKLRCMLFLLINFFVVIQLVFHIYGGKQLSYKNRLSEIF